MACSDNPIHKGNQAFIDEDYPATLQVRPLSLAGSLVLRYLLFSSTAFLRPCL